VQARPLLAQRTAEPDVDRRARDRGLDVPHLRFSAARAGEQRRIVVAAIVV
jgi:hypothetical protein